MKSLLTKLKTVLISTKKDPLKFIKNEHLITNKISKLPLFFSPYKKDYYLPLPAKTLYLPSSIKDLCSPISAVSTVSKLPLYDTNILSNVSGLATLTDQFRSQFITDPIFKQKFSKFILIELSKIIYYLFKTPVTKENFAAKILKCFNLIHSLTSVKTDKQFLKLVKDKYISHLQHLLTILCHKYSITKEDLQDFIKKQNIDLSHYKKLNVNTVIEFHILNLNLKYLVLDNTLNIIFTDNNNPLIKESGNLFVENESLLHTKQHCSDIIAYYLFFLENTIKILKFYRDMKADFYGPARGHFTLIPYLFSDYFIAHQHMNTYTSILKTIIKDENITISDRKLLIDDLTRLETIKNKCKVISDVKPVILEFNQYLLDISFKDIYLRHNIHFTLASDVDVDNVFIKDILPIINTNVEKHYTLFDIDIVFPKDNKINYDAFIRMLNKIILHNLPPELQDNLLSNLNNFIE